MTYGKKLSGEKYIYILMAFRLLEKSEKNAIEIGLDNGMKKSHNFYRQFKLHYEPTGIVISESKNSASFNVLTRYFVLGNPENRAPFIAEYITDCGDNLSRWND